MMPSSTDIRYFVEVATTGHLSKAAIRLGITQPSLTQSIQRLEAQLEESLFVRSRKGMTLTRAGQIVFSKASALLLNWEDIKVAAISLVYHRDNKSIATINKVASCIVASHLKKYGVRGVHEEKE